jgi:hypothetical protein
LSSPGGGAPAVELALAVEGAVPVTIEISVTVSPAAFVVVTADELSGGGGWEGAGAVVGVVDDALEVVAEVLVVEPDEVVVDEVDVDDGVFVVDGAEVVTAGEVVDDSATAGGLTWRGLI